MSHLNHSSCARDPTVEYSIDMEVDQLASFIFLKNTNNNIIELSLGGVENNKDLFCFFVDLLCKGLVLLFGRDNKLDVDEITEDDFRLVMTKMSLASIKVHLTVFLNDIGLPIGVNIRDIENLSDDLELNKYQFVVVSEKFIYRIHFELAR